MSVPALLPSAALVVLLAAVAADLLSCARGRAPARHDLPVAGAGVIAALLVAAGLGLAAPTQAVPFLAAWGSAIGMTVDLVVVLVVLSFRVPEAKRLVVLAVAATACARVVLVATGVGPTAGLSWVFGLLVLWLAWRLVQHGDSGLPEAGVLTVGMIPAAVVFAAFAVSATGGGSVLVLCANLLALIGAVRLVRLTARLCGSVPDASVGFSVVLVFIGVRSVLAGVAGRGPAQDLEGMLLSLAMTALVAVLLTITAVRERR
ncbi:hypothetical protein [Saccharopolyspora dendranthemae]|uniref:Uncharacterized protein n=1 Tax=Saccharopolyspora dendranthemae TaxID=1181886 RepID=A0A561U8Q3_9PSEU|nr:hypothetical protein [Saccharopolyspora dendranthemae]TWF95733.1 hypothetical protein FHU35_12732 [Saccharopolyspora dendranthemae]